MNRFIGATFRVLSMRCSDHTELLSRGLDEPLSAGERFGLCLHLRLCRGCRRFKAHLSRLRETARSLGEGIESGEPLPAALRNRLEARLGDVDEEN